MSSKRLLLAVAALATAVLSTGCTTGAFCFRDCEGDADGGGLDDASSDGAQNDVIFGDVQQECLLNCNDSGSDPDACKPTNGGIEICDGLDNDCNGQIDEEGPQIDFSSPATCGTCDNNCVKKVANADEATCTPTVKGQPGTCGYKTCSADYYDLNGDEADGCEYFCIKSSVNGQPVADEKDPSTVCNGKDDDCDGQADEDVDLCNDANNCGKCGRVCVVQNGTPECDHTGSSTTCDDTNTVCKVKQCDPGWVDLDGNYATGCEYPCTPTNGGVEICDNIDNDCDGLIDQFDPSLSDPAVGVQCFGGTNGLCADAAHAGTTACHNGTVSCDGPNVIKPGQITETCNSVDDDCNGQIDDNPTGEDTPCGSNVGNCSAGLNKCQNGAFACVGAVGPQPEVCNGQDDDCNGQIDDNPGDATGSCGITKGACQAGTKLCQSGTIVCVGAITPTQEICNGIDDDCDGTVDDGVSGEGDPCGNNVGACKAGAKHCQAGTFVCQGGTQGTPEVCDGIDNDCNGQIDDNPQGQNTPCGSNVGVCKQGLEKCQNGAFVCVGATSGSAEVCDGLDNDCNGKVDDAVPGVGVACGNSKGECKPGAMQCQSGQMICVGGTGPTAEVCDGKDNDCNGQIDDNPQGINVPCGSSVGNCVAGLTACESGSVKCVGSVGPSAEVCDGQDNDCNGVPDDNVPGLGGACDVPTPPPSGVTSPCQAGAWACVGGAKVCQGSVGPSSTTDKCGEDSNCDGAYAGPTPASMQSDVHNCGSCGNDCTALGGHATWACVTGKCAFQGCQTGYYDIDKSNPDCEYACTFVSAQEVCNGADDNCDGQIDENVTAPSPSQVCGVSPGASAFECTPYDAASNPGGVEVKCTSGNWKCTFHTAQVCTSGCAATAEICDAVDNNCNGLRNENVPNYGQPCASDDGKLPPGDGACRTTGTFVCDGDKATKCSATKDLTKAGKELCDGADNDCDGLVDETFNNKGTNSTYFVKPSVTKIASNLWIYSDEASRPGADAVSPGTGNGYYCASGCASGIPAAPAGITLDKTPACSVPGKVPWFNVTPIEAEQTCNAMGGRLCTTSDWQTACTTKPPGGTTCKWGYAPNGTDCTSGYTAGAKYCNLGPSFDFDAAAAGDQDGLLPTGSALLKNCYADWTALLNNGATAGKLYDITGNLREITKQATNQYPLMGGAYNTQAEDGASCSFTFYTVDQSFALYDAGFRCCFTADPTL